MASMMSSLHPASNAAGGGSQSQGSTRVVPPDQKLELLTKVRCASNPPPYTLAPSLSAGLLVRAGCCSVTDLVAVHRLQFASMQKRRGGAGGDAGAAAEGGSRAEEDAPAGLASLLRPAAARR
jgi:hypothetical protein